jgi:ureidoacrylate peracid hydrolase
MSDKHVKWEFERDRSVLLVIDMQNDFVLEGAILEVKEARNQIPAIRRLIGKCRELGVPVIYTVQETDALFCPLEVAAFPPLREAGMRAGSEGIKIIDELTPEPDDIIIRKRRFSAFYQTDLELILRNIRGPGNQVDTVIICGTVTNICCESTARDAYFRDYKVVFGTDICSANTPESHNATLVNMEIFGRPLDCETIICALENGKG